jgi:hypothetical protein
MAERAAVGPRQFASSQKLPHRRFRDRSWNRHARQNIDIDAQLCAEGIEGPPSHGSRMRYGKVCYAAPCQPYPPIEAIEPHRVGVFLFALARPFGIGSDPLSLCLLPPYFTVLTAPVARS